MYKTGKTLPQSGQVRSDGLRSAVKIRFPTFLGLGLVCFGEGDCSASLNGLAKFSSRFRVSPPEFDHEDIEAESDLGDEENLSGSSGDMGDVGLSSD